MCNKSSPISRSHGLTKQGLSGSKTHHDGVIPCYREILVICMVCPPILLRSDKPGQLHRVAGPWIRQWWSGLTIRGRDGGRGIIDLILLRILTIKKKKKDTGTLAAWLISPRKQHLFLSPPAAFKRKHHHSAAESVPSRHVNHGKVCAGNRYKLRKEVLLAIKPMQCSVYVQVACLSLNTTWGELSRWATRSVIRWVLSFKCGILVAEFFRHCAVDTVFVNSSGYQWSAFWVFFFIFFFASGLTEPAMDGRFLFLIRMANAVFWPSLWGRAVLYDYSVTDSVERVHLREIWWIHILCVCVSCSCVCTIRCGHLISSILK